MYRIYQVEYGDTLESIANKSNTTSDNIKKLNDFASDSDLIVGSLIIVPKVENQVFETYKIKSGDSIYSIARSYNIAPETLLLLNGLKKDEYIYPNQELLVPKSDFMIYVTRAGDTLEVVLDYFKNDANSLASENGRIFLIEEQLLVHKKEGKN